MIHHPQSAIRFDNKPLEYILSFYSDRGHQELFNLLELSYPNELVGFRLKNLGDNLYEISEYVAKATYLSDFPTFDFLRMVCEGRNDLTLDSLYFYQYGYELDGLKIPLCPVAIHPEQVLSAPYNKKVFTWFLCNWTKFDTRHDASINYNKPVVFQYRFTSDNADRLEEFVKEFFDNLSIKYKLSKIDPDEYVFTCNMIMGVDHPVFQFSSLADIVTDIHFKDILILQNGLKMAYKKNKNFPYFTHNIENALSVLSLIGVVCD